MFLKLHLYPMPDFDAALKALEAARAVCEQAGVPPIIAWRDSMALEEWYAGARPDGMVSDDELFAAEVWDSARVAARQALRLPMHVWMDIEVVLAGPHLGMPELHGPDRFTWRRNWAWGLNEWTMATLVKIRAARAPEGRGETESE
jgi:hypothetical protein